MEYGEDDTISLHRTGSTTHQKPVPLGYANGDEADVETWTRRATWSSLLEEFAALKRRVAKLEGRKFNPLPRRKKRED